MSAQRRFWISFLAAFAVLNIVAVWHVVHRPGVWPPTLHATVAAGSAAWAGWLSTGRRV